MTPKTAARIAIVRIILFAVLGIFVLVADIFRSVPDWQRYGLAALMLGYAAFRGVMYWYYMRKDDEDGKDTD